MGSTYTWEVVGLGSIDRGGRTGADATATTVSPAMCTWPGVHGTGLGCNHMPEATAKVMVSAVHPEASGGSSEGEQAPRRASFGAANLRRLVAQASPVNATSSASQTSPSLSGVALDALRQQRQSEAPPACGSQASKMVDCNRSFSSLSRFLSSKSSLKKRHRRHAAPLP